MNVTTFTDLTQDVVNICASYISPPELDYMASYHPVATDVRATAIFSQFATSYASPDTWDWQHGIDLRRDKKRRGTGRAAIEQHYRELNAYAYPLRSIPSPPSNHFQAHAKIQGYLIADVLHNRRWNFPFFQGSSGIHFLLQIAFAPVYEVEPASADYMLSKRFYCIKQFPPRALGDTTRNGYERFVSCHLKSIYTMCFMHGFGQLYAQYGGPQNLETLESHLNELIAYFEFVPNALVSAVNIESVLSSFPGHFKAAMPLKNTAAVRKFLFQNLRRLLKLPSTPHVQALTTLFKEELVRRKLLLANETHKKYALYGELLECDLDTGLETGLEILKDFIEHLESLECNTSQAGSAGASTALIDQDESTRGYITLLERFFRQPEDPSCICETTDQFFAMHGAHEKIAKFLYKAMELLVCTTASCQAINAVFMLVYNEYRRREISVYLADPLLKRFAQYPWPWAVSVPQPFVQNAALRSLLQQLAVQEEADVKRKKEMASLLEIQAFVTRYQASLEKPSACGGVPELVQEGRFLSNEIQAMLQSSIDKLKTPPPLPK